MSNVNDNICLELKNVGKSFGGLRAVDDISLQVRHGERLAIIGPNGAGKTTLFNMISGEYYPTDGQILLFGEDVTKLPNFKRVYRGLARTYQITTLFSDLTVLENTLLALTGTTKVKFRMFRSLKSKIYNYLYEEAKELLSWVGLYDKKDCLIRNLSYGDQRLVELVLALSSKPKVLCLDEPCAGLSVAESKMMLDVLKKLDESITLVLIEHDMDLVFGLAERIMVIHNGRWIATDTVEKIRANEQVQKIYLGVGE